MREKNIIRAVTVVLGLSVVISASLPDRTSFLRERERERGRGDGRGGRKGARE